MRRDGQAVLAGRATSIKGQRAQRVIVGSLHEWLWDKTPCKHSAQHELCKRARANNNTTEDLPVIMWHVRSGEEGQPEILSRHAGRSDRKTISEKCNCTRVRMRYINSKPLRTHEDVRAYFLECEVLRQKKVGSNDIVSD